MTCKHVPTCGPNDDCFFVDSLNTGKTFLFSDGAQHDSLVKHPSHYGSDTTYEAIKVIEAWELTFNTGNAVKYICRAGHKDPSIEKHIEDLEKAREYLRFEVERLKRLKV